MITLLILARTLHLGSAMMLVALPYFRLVIFGPVFAADTVGSYRSFCRKLTKWLWLALFLQALSGAVWFWLVAAQMSDQSPWGPLDLADLNTVLGQTQFGRLWLGRALVGAALGAALYFLGRRETQPGASFLDRFLLALGGLLLITLAWAGHAAAGIHHPLFHLIADTLHLLLGAIWPVGLIPLACFLRFVDWNQILPADREIEALRRFSRISFIAVLFLVATGWVNAWLMIGSWEALVTTTYGKLLLAKVLVVGIMVGLGAVNQLRLVPQGPPAFRILRKTVLAESCLALVVLLLVGIMGMTSPPS